MDMNYTRKIFQKALALLLAAGLLAVTLTGCGENEASSGAVSTASQSSSAGSGEAQVVRINVNTEPDNLNPWLSAASDTDAIFFNVFEGLCFFDEQGEMTPALAESWDISEDGKTYTFHLRQGVTFHNGKAFTSADALYTYNALTGLGGEDALTGKFSMVESLEAPDDHTFVVRLNTPSATFLSQTIIAILPEGYDEQETHPIGTGPFKFVEYTPSQRVVLERNEDYYNQDRQPKIDRAEIYIMSDNAAVVSALQSGQLDIAYAFDAADASVLEKDYDIYSSPQNMVQVFALNNEVAPFNDVRVRQAISYAVDKDQIIDGVLNGYGTKLVTNFSPAMGVYYNGDLEELYPTDVEKAKALLKEAGYENGFTATLTVPANYQAHIDTAQVIAQQLSAVGITLNIETMEWGTWLDEVYKGAKYETTIIGLSGKLDPDAVLVRYKSDYGANFFRFNNAEYDSLIESAKVETDEQKRVEDYKRCQEILAEEAAAVFVSDPNLVVACRRDLKGYTFYPVTFMDFTSLYYESRACKAGD